MIDPLAALLSEHRQCGKPYDGCYSHYPILHCRADGMTWPCDVDRIRDHYAQPAAPAEGRVAEVVALLTTVIEDAESQHPGGWGPDVSMVKVLKVARATLEGADR